MQGAGVSGLGRVLPPKELWDDLGSRFVLNVPEEELQSFERILFLIELAHWFYEDNTREQHPQYKTLSLREFTSLMFQNCQALHPYIQHVDNIYKDFTSYKVGIPTVGAIILDKSYDRCLMVKGWKASTWGFPKGKKSKDEPDLNCAIREVLEEIGYDISGLLSPETFLEVEVGQQRSRLYVVTLLLCGDEEERCSFKPQTRKEISEIAWHRIDDLPLGTGDAPVAARGSNGAKYYMVWPFTKQLRKMVQRLRRTGPQRERAGSSTGPAIQTVWKVSSSLIQPMSSGNALAALAQESGQGSALFKGQVPRQAEIDHLGVGAIVPAYAFKNFQFDTASIMQVLESRLRYFSENVDEV